jgi:hypothetical protein
MPDGSNRKKINLALQGRRYAHGTFVIGDVVVAACRITSPLAGAAIVGGFATQPQAKRCNTETAESRAQAPPIASEAYLSLASAGAIPLVYDSKYPPAKPGRRKKFIVLMPF